MISGLMFTSGSQLKKLTPLIFLTYYHHSKGPPIIIVNYEAVRMLGVLRALRIWAARGRVYLSIDESIAIKGFKSAQTKAIHALAPVCTFTRLLTGRPQAQGPNDLLEPAAGDRTLPFHRLLRLPRSLLHYGRLE